MASITYFSSKHLLLECETLLEACIITKMRWAKLTSSPSSDALGSSVYVLTCLRELGSALDPIKFHWHNLWVGIVVCEAAEGDGSMDRDWGSKPGSGGAASAQNEAIDRRERLRRLALENIDLAKDPYFMRNHLGRYILHFSFFLFTNP